ncbi:MAG: hypothetical protein AB1414_06290, partial [bacterium]
MSIKKVTIQPQIDTDETLKIRKSCPVSVSVIRLKGFSPVVLCPLPSALCYSSMSICVNCILKFSSFIKNKINKIKINRSRVCGYCGQLPCSCPSDVGNS